MTETWERLYIAAIQGLSAVDCGSAEGLLLEPKEIAMRAGRIADAAYELYQQREKAQPRKPSL